MLSTMKLIDKTVENFSSLLASEASTPGGGSTAALEAVLGVSLITMVAMISAGKEDYTHRKEALQDIIEQAEDLRKKLLLLIDEDTTAYNGLIAARRDTEEQASGYQEALKQAVAAPYAILKGAQEGLGLAKQVSQEYYLSTASDLGLAVQSLKTAAQGAELTMLINLRSITDEAFGKQYRYESHILLEESLSLAEELYDEVRTRLMDMM